MQARVLCVYDEGALEDTPLIGAKGLSILVEVDGQRTLFDVGMRGRYLLRNMENLGIEPDSIDRVVISHNHRSNLGGLGKLLNERTKPLDIYVNEDFVNLRKLFGNDLLSDEQKEKAVFHEMKGNMTISDHLIAIGPFGRMKEFSLILRTLKGPVVMTSCYHNGTRCVFEEVRAVTGKNPYCLVGGLHTPKAKQKTIDPTAAIIKEFEIPRLYMGHCIGPGITYLRVHFKLDGVKDFYVGTSIKFDVVSGALVKNGPSKIPISEKEE